MIILPKSLIAVIIFVVCGKKEIEWAPCELSFGKEPTKQSLR